MKKRGDEAHNKDLKHPVELRLAGGDRIPVLLLVEEGEYELSVLGLGGFPLDLRNTPEIEAKVSKFGTMPISAGPTHAVKFVIASRTGRLN